MNAKETLNKIANFLKGVEDVELSEVKEEVVQEEAQAQVQELAKDEVEQPKEVVEKQPMNFATKEELSSLKTELMEMLKAIIEEKTTVNDKEVPQELAKQEVELEVVEEIVHSPESEVEKKHIVNFESKRPLSIQDRVNQMLFN